MEAPVAPSPSPPGRAIAPGGLPAPSGRVVVLVAGIAGLATLLWVGRDVLAPFVVGLLFVYLLDPVVERLARLELAGRRLPRALLVLAVYIVVAAVLVELVVVLAGPLVEQVQAFARDAPGYLDQLHGRLDELLGWWRRLDLPADVREAIDKAVADLPGTLASLIPTILRPVFSSVLGLVGSVFGYLVVPVWAFWILKDRPALVRGFERAVPEGWRPDTRATVGIVRRVFGSWIRGQLLLGLTVGVATFIGLLVLGALVDPVFSRYAILLAVIAGVLELLPIIGPIISAVPAVLLGATAGVPGVVAALLLYVAVQQLENNILVPKIQGDATDLHPAVVIFALVLGGAIAGLLGAILALPVAAALRDLYVYAFRRASGQTPAEAARGDARGDAGAAVPSTTPAAAVGTNGEPADAARPAQEPDPIAGGGPKPDAGGGPGPGGLPSDEGRLPGAP